MPELPEIETIRLSLCKIIIGKKFIQIKTYRPNLRIPFPKSFKEIVQSKIISITRRSKYLLISFASQQTLIIHLGMSGRLFFTKNTTPLDKHDHIIFKLDKITELRLRDPRRFGLVTLCPTPDVPNHALIKNIGIEPLHNNFNATYLFKLCKKSKAPIKNLLMNASLIAGVGNIYANEALYMSQIRPNKSAAHITTTQAHKLCKNIKKVLRESIKSGGTTFKDFVGVNEEPGLHALKLNVYNRNDQPCKKCKTMIKAYVLGGRMSYYCPSCQK